MNKHGHTIALATLGIVMLLAFSPAVAASSTSGTISIIGTEGVNIGHKVFASFRFSPIDFEINHGGVITFENLVTHDMHTISIVNPADLPTNINQVFGCGAPGTVCAKIFAAHIPNGFNPVTGQPNPPVLVFVTVSGNPPGFAMNSVQGNSILIFPGQTLQVTITAPSGATLHYMCAIHPWMQGTINVK